jgi:hypothetical protein
VPSARAARRGRARPRQRPARTSSSGGDEQAVAADRQALEVLTPEVDPGNWATADELRGGATDQMRERDPDARVSAQAALAMTLEQLGELEWHQERGDESRAYQLDRASEEHMEEAVAAARAGLTMVTEQGSPNMWGYLQDQQAAALEEIGYREASNHDNGLASEHLGEAVAADRAALRTLTMTNAPDNWADAERNLGDALAGLNEFRAEFHGSPRCDHRLSRVDEGAAGAVAGRLGHIAEQSWPGAGKGRDAHEGQRRNAISGGGHRGV